ncbi:hypothetical protein AOQ84DRAFT_22927 [Glonium stellatum]|uniref:Uncharacterized protein n=1 Tax=Glonium stellatum TaxID=574774 RepID=A0A8E2FCN3_9PEZI|nr:hypothetical protein AOQ84DRAFT_22927 [Glonium stellatum]
MTRPPASQLSASQLSAVSHFRLRACSPFTTPETSRRLCAEEPPISFTPPGNPIRCIQLRSRVAPNFSRECLVACLAANVNAKIFVDYSRYERLYSIILHAVGSLHKSYATSPHIYSSILLAIKSRTSLCGRRPKLKITRAFLHFQAGTCCVCTLPL